VAPPPEIRTRYLILYQLEEPSRLACHVGDGGSLSMPRKPPRNADTSGY